MPPRAVVLTFDDGLYDFLACAVPLLKEFGFTATNYVSTYYSEFQRPVFPVASSYILWKAGPRILNVRALTGRNEEFALADAAARAKAQSHILDFAAENALSGPERDALLGRLAALVGVDYEELCRRRILQLMTPAELREVADAGIDLQLHTHRHRTPRSRELFIREIEDNRQSLAASTGRRASHFCYPSGVHSPEFLPTGPNRSPACHPHRAGANARRQDDRAPLQ